MAFFSRKLPAQFLIVSELPFKRALARLISRFLVPLADEINFKMIPFAVSAAN
jgi:hypothetical protein